MTSRYGVEPARLKGKKDIVEYVKDLSSRVSAGETGLRVGHTAIEDGDLIVRNGNIIVSETDNSIVMRILHGSIPEIRFYPLGVTDTHQCYMFGLDFDGGSGIDQALQLGVETTGLVQDGGKVLMSRSYAILSHQPNGGSETYLWLNADALVPGTILFRGRWSNQLQFDTSQALYTGSFDTGGGFSNWTHTYASAFATTICPIVGLVNSVDTAVAWMITGMSTSSFKVRWASGTDSKTINFWNFRI